MVFTESTRHPLQKTCLQHPIIVNVNTAHKALNCPPLISGCVDYVHACIEMASATCVFIIILYFFIDVRVEAWRLKDT